MGYIRNYDIPATMALANAVGAATAMGTGAGTNVASAQTVLQLLTDASADSTASNGNNSKAQNGDAVHGDQSYGNAAALLILQESLNPEGDKSAAAA